MPLGPNPQSDTRVRGNLLGSPVLRFGLIQCHSPKQDPLDSMEGGRGRCYRPQSRWYLQSTQIQRSYREGKLGGPSGYSKTWRHIRARNGKVEAITGE